MFVYRPLLLDGWTGGAGYPVTHHRIGTSGVCLVTATAENNAILRPWASNGTVCSGEEDTTPCVYMYGCYVSCVCVLMCVCMCVCVCVCECVVVVVVVVGVVAVVVVCVCVCV